jgi:hypothetical protein
MRAELVRAKLGSSVTSVRAGEGLPTMASRAREIPRDGGSHPEHGRVKTLARSLSVLDEWLEKDEGRTDEGRVRRVRGWREEALEQLRLSLGAERP